MSFGLNRGGGIRKSIFLMGLSLSIREIKTSLQSQTPTMEAMKNDHSLTSAINKLSFSLCYGLKISKSSRNSRFSS